MKAVDRYSFCESVNSLMAIIRQLRELGDNVNDPLLETLIEGKLPQWALLEIYNDKQHADDWNVDQLCAKLQLMVKVRENIKWSHPVERQKSIGQDKDVESSSAFTITQQQQQRGPGIVLNKYNSSGACPFCGGKHWAARCEQYNSAESRTNNAKQQKLCLRCLKKDHIAKDCWSKIPCYYCGKANHHQAFCYEAAKTSRSSHQHASGGSRGARQSRRQPTMATAVSNNNNISSMQLNRVNTALFGQRDSGEDNFAKNQILLPTTYADVINPNNPDQRYKAVVLFDSGSDSTYVTKELVQQLNLPIIGRRPVTISGFGETTTQLAQTDIVEVQVARNDGPTTIRALVVPKLTHKILTVELPAKLLTQRSILSLETQAAPVSVLIGVDQMDRILDLASATKLPSGFTLFQSRLGMILSGKGKTDPYDNPSADSLTVTTSISEDPVERFWKLELIGIMENPAITDDEVAIQRPIDLITPATNMSPSPGFRDSNSESDEEYMESANNRDILVRSWTHSKRFIERFWNAWETDYLLSLRERTQRNHKSGKIITHRLPQLGEVVIMHDESKPRPLWKLGVIDKLITGTDGNIRSAELNCGTNNKNLSRPVNLLYPLEIHNDDAAFARTQRDKTQATNGENRTPKGNEERKNSNNQYQGPITRSRTRALETSTTLTSCLLLLAIITQFGEATKCGNPKGGVPVRFPAYRNCSVMERGGGSVWTEATIYTRTYVTTPAYSCTNHSRTVCTNSFFHLTLSVTSDYTNVSGISPQLCTEIIRTKKIDGNQMVLRSNNRWETDVPEDYSFGWIGTRCQTTSNYVLQYGSVAIYADDRLFETNRSVSAECKAKDGVCITDHTLIWNVTNANEQCHYKLLGTYTVYATPHFVSVKGLEASFGFKHYVPALPKCDIQQVYLLENDFAMVFEDKSIRGSFSKWMASNPRWVSIMNREHEKDIAASFSPYMNKTIFSDDKNSILGYFWEKSKSRYDPINVKLQFVYNLLRRQINQHFPRMEQSICESNNAVNLIARTSPPTIAARILLQRTDVEAIRLSEDALLVSTCDSNITTDSNSSSSDQTIDEFTFKASPLPNLERQRIDQALSLLHSEMQQVSADVGSDTPTDGTFDSLRNEGEKILWMAEDRVTKTAEEIQAVLNTISNRYVIIAIIIGVTLLGIAALLLYLKFTGCLGSSNNVRIQFPSTSDNERVTATGIELKEMVRSQEPTNATMAEQRPMITNATPGIQLQRPASIFSPLISPL
ncbi:unnamed protein product [Anisakis simplex]|uniref:CCHC-type domain-containing protein n=1 Tax=Anisakis simplex TaxID=6269 RepID=A0A0M3IZ50_ANISI|nr:unnamed protein product [Anisakis simplex]